MDLVYVLVGKSINGTYYINHGTSNEMSKACKTLQPLVADELKVIEYDGDLEALIDDSTAFNNVFGTLFDEESQESTEDKEESLEERLERESANFNFDDDDDDDLLG